MPEEANQLNKRIKKDRTSMLRLDFDWGLAPCYSSYGHVGSCSTTCFPCIWVPNSYGVSTQICTAETFLRVSDCSEGRSDLLNARVLCFLEEVQSCTKENILSCMLLKPFSRLTSSKLSVSCDSYHRCNRPGFAAFTCEFVRICGQSCLLVNSPRCAFVSWC